MYLASYGQSDTMNPTTNTYSEKPLADILQKDVRSFIQSELYNEYGVRTVDQINGEMISMLDVITANLREEFSKKGITIVSFGFSGGNVFENPAIQVGIDSVFARQQQQQEVQANATRQAVVNAQNLDTAYAQATQTAVAARSAAESQEMLAEALSANPNLVIYELARKWNGQLPQIMGESGSLPMIPFNLIPPTGATATPTP